jgi:hypothetical protein
VWYPSGGFGHFVNAVISLHGDNFVRPKNKLEFSNKGDSHSLELAAPKYFHDQDYNFEFDNNFNYLVLVDNGINNEGLKFLEIFPTAKIIKMCYTDTSWPVIAKTMIDKAMKSSIESELPVDNWTSNENWAKREKYFLFLRDHSLRNGWRNDSTAININIETMLNYKEFKSAIVASGISVVSFRKLWNNWLENNFQYFMPILFSQDVISQVKKKKSIDLTMITDVWVQAVVYYYIWLEFGVEVPHNDYSNWFTNTDEIVIMLNKLGVTV